jgi:hypothetical protein
VVGCAAIAVEPLAHSTLASAASHGLYGDADAHGAGPGRLALDSSVVRMPIDVRGNLVYLRGRVNASDSLWIVLDSGAAADVINASRARELGLSIAEGGEAHGSGGAAEAGRVRGATVNLPGVALDGAPLTTLSLDDIGARTGRDLDAILGYPLLSRCVVEIDYAAGTLTIREGDHYHYAGGGTVLPLEFKERLPYVRARITLPGRAPIDGRFVIDTGSGNAIILAAPFVREQRVLEAVPKTIQVRNRGVGGGTQNLLARVSSLTLGGIRLDAPTATLRVSDVGHIAASGASGNIGGDVLRRFKVIFDYPRRRMILEPNARLADPFEADMSGLGVRAGPGETRAFLVEWIQPSSPAEESGFAPGDLIERVDGTPSAELGLPAWREMCRRPGETHRLGILRGEAHLEIAFTTRRML